MTVAFIEPAALPNSVEKHELLALVLSPDALTQPTADVELPSLPEISVPGDEREDGLGAGRATDRSEYAMMAGRYIGQITARIERAWTRPRTPVTEGLFACQARITQNNRGDVEQIRLRHCNGDQRWQHSLVSAIETASPLPAPPDPRVFARIVLLDFRSLPYAAGSNADGFER